MRYEELKRTIEKAWDPEDASSWVEHVHEAFLNDHISSLEKEELLSLLRRKVNSISGHDDLSAEALGQLRMIAALTSLPLGRLAGFVHVPPNADLVGITRLLLRVHDHFGQATVRDATLWVNTLFLFGEGDRGLVNVAAVPMMLENRYFSAKNI